VAVIQLLWIDPSRAHCRYVGTKFGIRKRFQLVSIEIRLVAQTPNGGGEGMMILKCLQSENVTNQCTWWLTI
jgi:hypothetical protein